MFDGLEIKTLQDDLDGYVYIKDLEDIKNKR